MPQNQNSNAKEWIRVLSAISTDITTTLDLNEVLNHVIRLVRKTFKADACLLYLVDHAKKEVWLRASQNKSSAKFIGNVHFPLGKGITGWVAEHQDIVALNEKAYDDKRFVSVNALPEDTFEAFLSVPILFHRRLIGVMNVQYRKPHPFSEDEVGLGHLIGQHIAGAIRNAELVEETQTLQEALETRKVVDKAKALLIRRGMTEDAAHRLIRQKSMDSRKSLREIAEAILLLAELP